MSERYGVHRLYDCLQFFLPIEKAFPNQSRKRLFCYFKKYLFLIFFAYLGHGGLIFGCRALLVLPFIPIERNVPIANRRQNDDGIADEAECVGYLLQE